MKGSDQSRVHAALQRSLSGLSLPPDDYSVIRSWINEEVPHLLAAGQTCSLLFGSYRRGYHRSVRVVQYELGKETTATAIVLGDTPTLELSLGSHRTDPLEFELRFHLLSEFADRNVAIYEKDSGGETVELGLLRQEPCFSQTVVLPRDYYGVGPGSFESREELLTIASHIAMAADLEESQKRRELRGLLATAREEGIDLTEHELTEFLEAELTDRAEDAPAYSWVHLALFRHFEEAGRCLAWHSEADLRSIARELRASSLF
ncbi:MAG: hypothetical protein U5K37_09955 [Natrialbaceae archaeon]|nr:hypothetical protein [Natrialbaceae archaeon]